MHCSNIITQALLGSTGWQTHKNDSPFVRRFRRREGDGFIEATQVFNAGRQLTSTSAIQGTLKPDGETIATVTWEANFSRNTPDHLILACLCLATWFDKLAEAP